MGCQIGPSKLAQPPAKEAFRVAVGSAVQSGHRLRCLARAAQIVTALSTLLIVTGAHADTAKLVPLHAWWATSTADNRTTSDPSWIGLPGDTHGGGYGFHRVMGWVYSPDLPQPADTVALYGWFSDSRGDHLLSSQPYWAATTPGTVRDGYRFLRKEGYLPVAPSGRANVPLMSWWSASREDNYATTMPDWSGSAGDSREGYARYRLEGYVFGPESRSELKRFSQNTGLPSSVAGSFFREQGQSMHCQTFTATAALEAAYKRKYPGNWDLSEEFLGYLGKITWLNSDVSAPVDLAQNQIGLYGGGGGTGMLRLLKGGARIPRENATMPYIPMWTQDLMDERGRRMINPDAGGDSTFLDELGRSVGYPSQDFVNALNFGPVRIDTGAAQIRLPRTMLDQPLYHGVDDIEILCDGSPSAHRCPGFVASEDVEALLRAGHEVLYDIRDGSHVMLIVGYDRTDPDPTKHFFLVKNSYGFDYGGEDGFLREPYANVLNASALGAIMSVTAPSEWKEIRSFGRWNLVFDGHRAELTVHRVPGSFNSFFADAGVGNEIRLGTFKDSAGSMFRVNGALAGNLVSFWVDAAHPSAPFAARAGRSFNYYMAGRDHLTLAGFHSDPGSSEVFAGYATQGATFAGSGSPLSGSQRWLGTWDVHTDGRIDTMEVLTVSGTVATVNYRRLGLTTRVSGSISGNLLTVGVPSGGSIITKELNHQPGVAAGVFRLASGDQGVVLTRH